MVPTLTTQNSIQCEKTITEELVLTGHIDPRQNARPCAQHPKGAFDPLRNEPGRNYSIKGRPITLRIEKVPVVTPCLDRTISSVYSASYLNGSRLAPTESNTDTIVRQHGHNVDTDTGCACRGVRKDYDSCAGRI